MLTFKGYFVSKDFMVTSLKYSQVVAQEVYNIIISNTYHSHHQKILSVNQQTTKKTLQIEYVKSLKNHSWFHIISILHYSI